MRMESAKRFLTPVKVESSLKIIYEAYYLTRTGTALHWTFSYYVGHGYENIKTIL